MTEERDNVTAVDADVVTTGRAAEILRPAAAMLGRAMTGLQVRRLAERGDLIAVRPAEGGWRSVSLASVIAYRTHLEQQVALLAQQEERYPQ